MFYSTGAAARPSRSCQENGPVDTPGASFRSTRHALALLFQFRDSMP